MWLSEQKPAMFAYKLNFICILLPQLIAILNNYMHVHCLHWIMSTGLLLQSVFFSDHVNPWWPVKWHQWRATIWQWGLDIAPTVKTRLSRPCSRILALSGCMYIQFVHIIATLNSTIVILLLCINLFHHPPHLTPLLPMSLYTLTPILMNSMKKIVKK